MSAVDESRAVRRARRTRQRRDLIRVGATFAALIATLALGQIGGHTASGLESDLHHGAQLAPPFLLDGALILTAVAIAVVSVGLALDRLMRRDRRRLADAIIAAALSYGVAGLLDVWLTSGHAPGRLLTELTRHLDSGSTVALQPSLAAVIGFLTVVGFHDRPSLRTFTGCSLGISVTTTLVEGDSALVGLAVTCLLGHGIGVGWSYVRGESVQLPLGRSVLAALAQAGLAPASCVPRDTRGSIRRYAARSGDGRQLDVDVLDRDGHTSGLIHRVYRRIRLRAPAQRGDLFSLRRTIEREALMSYALAQAGIATPKLLAVREISADATLLAYEHVAARPLAELAEEEFTDALITAVWTTVRELGRHQIAHRGLTLDAVLADGQGRIWLTQLRNGHVAADEIQHLLDIAETLTAIALKTGPERAVRIGTEVLGEDRISAALPFIQPILLSRANRVALRAAKRLPSRLREQILALHPQAPTTEARLERFRPRTILAVCAGGFAVYALMLEVASVGNAGGHGTWRLLADASPAWLLLAAAAAAVTYAAAAAQLAGFVPERLPKARNIQVQLASSFVALFAPAAVGGVALNVRFLRRRGIPTGPALSAVGAAQAVAFILHVALFAVLSFFASGGARHDEASATVAAILLGLAVTAMLTLAIPPLRRFAQRRLAPFFAGSLPRLLDVAQNPRKLALAIGGTVAISLLNALCLWSCVHALSPAATPSYPTVTLVYLTVQALTSASPTPAGMGAVELGLGTALAFTGVAKPEAVVAVLAYRLLTTYLPAAPGYVCLRTLRRKRAV